MTVGNVAQVTPGSKMNMQIFLCVFSLWGAPDGLCLTCREYKTLKETSENPNTEPNSVHIKQFWWVAD